MFSFIFFSMKVVVSIKKEKENLCLVFFCSLFSDPVGCTISMVEDLGIRTGHPFVIQPPTTPHMRHDSLVPNVVRWTPPPQQSFKVNFDTTVINDEMGIRVLFVTPKCNTMMVLESSLSLTSLVELVEAVALHEGIYKVHRSGPFSSLG